MEATTMLEERFKRKFLDTAVKSESSMTEELRSPALSGSGYFGCLGRFGCGGTQPTIPAIG
ncbi:hypothetical protein LPU83_3346 [Rhizobium favelukesii]|uniref:Uncharacterized protein n=1 Tax=Rhizobium favelukesii TaxID=348824 RepID=W6RXM6_9HYPH|nr:hypothetical protein LPU83_3346 [Rhizobium favelukesii]